MNQNDLQLLYYNKYLKYETKFNNLKSILDNYDYTSLNKTEINNQIYTQIAGGNFTFGLKQPWFDYIKNQIKTIEGRKYFLYNSL